MMNTLRAFAVVALCALTLSVRAADGTPANTATPPAAKPAPLKLEIAVLIGAQPTTLVFTATNMTDKPIEVYEPANGNSFIVIGLPNGKEVEYFLTGGQKVILAPGQSHRWTLDYICPAPGFSWTQN